MAGADGVQRAGMQPANTQAPSPHAATLARIEQETPDLPVGVSEDGKHSTAREELEAVRREAAEGTDTALGADDAHLLEVAAQCYLASA